MSYTLQQEHITVLKLKQNSIFEEAYGATDECILLIMKRVEKL